MKTIHIITICLTALFFASCSSVRVTSDYKEGTAFKGFTSYEIVSPDNLSGQVTPAHKMQIEKAIRLEMNNRQFQEASSETDLSVSYFVFVNTVRDYDNYVSLYGNRRWGYAMVQTTVREYKEGTLIVDIIDNKKQEVIWHGAATDIVKKGMKNVDGKINEAVQAIFDKYSKEAALASN